MNNKRCTANRNFRMNNIEETYTIWPSPLRHKVRVKQIVYTNEIDLRRKQKICTATANNDEIKWKKNEKNSARTTTIF